MLKSGTFREISVRGGNVNPDRIKDISTSMTTRKEGEWPFLVQEQRQLPDSI